MKLSHSLENFAKTFKEHDQSFDKLTQQLKQLNKVATEGVILSRTRCDKSKQESDEVSLTSTKVKDDLRDLSDFQKKLNSNSNREWKDIELILSRENETVLSQVKYEFLFSSIFKTYYYVAGLGKILFFFIKNPAQWV